jgi:hypothetical protein
MLSSLEHGPLPKPRCIGKARLFFSDKDRDIRQAQALCGGCVQREECARGAIDRREPYGVWGGLDERDIRRAVRAAPAAAA